MTRALPCLACVLLLVACEGARPHDEPDASTPPPPWAPPQLPGAPDAGPVVTLTLVQDLNQQPLAADARGYLEHQGRVFYGARGADGWSLFATDGTAAGTAAIATRASWQDAPTPVASFGGRLFFSVRDAFVGNELWASDGTGPGTALMVDAAPGVTNGFSREVGVVGGALYFLDASSRLWRSGGQPQTTGPVGDFAIAASGFTGVRAIELGGRLLFASQGGDDGGELWLTDGTPSGTTRVKDIRPGPAGSTPTTFTRLGTRVLFFADDGEHGLELWVTDGTPAGTTLVADINPGPASGANLASSRIYAHGGVAYLCAGDGSTGLELWRTDGTGPGTALVKDLNPGSTSGAPGQFGSLGQHLLFWAEDAAAGREPYVSDGTAGGTALLRDLRPGPTTSALGSPFVVHGGLALFRADDGSHGAELWKTDGTPLGTARITDLWPGAGHGATGNPRAAAGKIFFSGSDGAGPGGAPHVTDGTAAGTLPLGAARGRQTGASLVAAESSRSRFVQVGDRFFFPATDTVHGQELWVMDRSGARRVKDINPGAPDGVPLAQFAAGGQHVYFVANHPDFGQELWVSDGTEAGTHLLKDLRPGPAGSAVGNLVFIKGRLYFFADDGSAAGHELWSSDGTAEGTRRLLDLDTRPYNSGLSPRQLGLYADLILFNGFDGESWGVFRLTDAGTAVRLTPANLMSFLPLAAFQGEVYFATGTPVGFAPQGPQGLYRTDGTAQGTVFVSRHFPTEYFERGSELGFVQGGELWSFNVKQEAPTLVAALDRVDPPVAFGGALYFLGGNGSAGTGLWRSDLTAAGTTLVHRLAIAPHTLAADNLTPRVAGGRMFFAAGSSPAGLELWSSDGSAGGTRPVADLNPGPQSSTPVWLTPVDEKTLYLALDDGTHGVEPWRLEIR